MWYKEDNAQKGITVSSRIRLARNLSDLPFSSRMSQNDMSVLKERVKSALKEIEESGGIALKYIESDDIPEQELAAMVERHIISPDFARNHRGRAVAISEDESISIMIGEEDHLRIQVIVSGDDIDKAYDLADRVDTALNERLGFAYHNTLGYLTECPTNIGTGLRASVMLHLPVCESRGEINSIADAAGKIGLTVRGMYGEGSTAKASLYQVSNQITLGISEQNAIENLKAIASQIVEREKHERTVLLPLKLEDTVFRALGTLKYARLLDSEEFMNLISMIKLGIDEGIIEDKGIKPIELLIDAQPYMLRKKFSANSPEERDEVRAKMIRELL